MSLTRRGAALAIALTATISGPPSASAASTPTSSQATAAGPAQITGVLTTPDRRPLRTGAVILRPLSATVPPAAAHDAEMLPDGRFAFRNVPPGRYLLRASAETRSGERVPLFATMMVEVHPGDVADVNLVMQPGGGIAGVVVRDAGSSRAAALAGVRVRAPLVDDPGFDDSPEAEVAPDGTFEMRGLMKGARYITLDGLPSPLVVKRVVYRDRDITDRPITVEPGGVFRGVRVTVTDRASEISGVVRNDRGEPADGALVVVVPAPPTTWTRASRRVRAVRTDASGRYRVRGLPAGEYRAFASANLVEADVYDVEAVEPFVASAVALTVEDLTSRSLDMHLSVLPRRLSTTR